MPVLAAGTQHDARAPAPDRLDDRHRHRVADLEGAVGQAQVLATDEPEQLLNYGGGIALVIAALAFFLRQPGKPTDDETTDTPR